MAPELFLGNRVTVLAGDCREVLASLPENHFDSCVCDPPYHLHSIVKRFAKTGRTDKTRTTSGPHQRTARGFMGRTWDGGDIAFDPATWEAVLRVLKPGAFLLCFGSTRTYHRIACAIEDAGFTIYDTVSWLYGCVSEDTEVLTRHGWKRGVDVQEGEHVAAWDSGTGKIELQPVLRHFL